MQIKKIITGDPYEMTVKGNQIIDVLNNVGAGTADTVQAIIDKLAAGEKIIRLNPTKEYIIRTPIFINIDKVAIIGNGATLTRENNTSAQDFATFIVNKSDVKISNVNFKGCKTANIDNSTWYKSHHGIVAYNAMRLIVDNCSFKYYNGCGILLCSAGQKTTQGGVLLGSSDWDIFAVGTKIINNNFSNCKVGIANTFRYEYSQTANNKFDLCSCGLWDESGNWIHTGNMSVRTNHGFCSTGVYMLVAFTHPLAGTIQSNNDNYFGKGNNAHGNINGFIANHAIDGATSWGDFTVGIVSGSGVGNWNIKTHLSGNYCGVFGFTGHSPDTIIPPNLNNLTLYYSGLAFRDIITPATGKKWIVNNIVISGTSATVKGALRSAENNKIKALGYINYGEFVDVYNVEIA